MEPTVIDPKTTPRAEAYALWMNAPNPMVTFFQNAGCHAAGSAQPQARAEIRYASLLVYRRSAGSRSFILSLLGASCCTMTETVFDMHKSKKYGS